MKRLVRMHSNEVKDVSEAGFSPCRSTVHVVGV